VVGQLSLDIYGVMGTEIYRMGPIDVQYWAQKFYLDKIVGADFFVLYIEDTVISWINVSVS
jgi:hypothetical protein